MKFKCLALSFVIIVYFAVAYFFSPTICIFRNVTGLPCPGCGLTRAYLALFKGNIKKAFIFHPLFLFPILIAVILIYNKLKNNKFCMNNKLAILLVAIFIVVYIIRMIILFPNSEPMTINYNGMIPTFIKMLSNI